jgi:hypothetical protein
MCIKMGCWQPAMREKKRREEKKKGDVDKWLQ